MVGVGSRGVVWSGCRGVVWFGCRGVVGVGSRGVVWFGCRCRGEVGSGSRGGVVLVVCDGGCGDIVGVVALDIVGGFVLGNWALSCCSSPGGSFPPGHVCPCGFGSRAMDEVCANRAE